MKSSSTEEQRRGANQNQLQDEGVAILAQVLRAHQTMTPLDFSTNAVGTIGAVDADGDEIVYRLVRGPRQGAVSWQRPSLRLRYSLSLCLHWSGPRVQQTNPGC